MRVVRHSVRLLFPCPNRLWILRHLAMGYSVHVQRLLMILTVDFLPLLVADYNALTEAAAQVRYDIFKTCEYPRRTGKPSPVGPCWLNSVLAPKGALTDL